MLEVALSKIKPRIKTYETGCWEWQGSLRKGYGYFRIGKSKFSTHRLSYMIFYW